MYSVDVIIPTYKPTEKFFRILDMLDKQTYPVNRIIIVNTEEKYFDRLLFSSPQKRIPEKVTVRHISRREFDHGGTRRLAVKMSDADIFICMTDDALPADEKMIEYLVKALSEEKVAVAYARQLSDEHATLVEHFTRNYNYPDTSLMKSEEDVEKLGIKTYFCSNVCAAYWRHIYDESGGFIKHTIFNEDMIFAGKRILAGDKVAYVAEAKVIHSHNYTGSQQFHRNFDLAVSQAQHQEVFEGVPSEGEGIRMVKATAKYLIRSGQPLEIWNLIYQSGCKYMGYFLGKRYEKLPKWLVLKCTSSPKYWKKS